MIPYNIQKRIFVLLVFLAYFTPLLRCINNCYFGDNIYLTSIQAHQFQECGIDFIIKPTTFLILIFLSFLSVLSVNGRKYTELDNDDKSIDAGISKKYFIYSNISDVDDEVYYELHNTAYWTPIKRFKKNFVEMVLFERAPNNKTY